MKLINMDDEIFKAYCYENFDADKNGMVTADEVAEVHILTITSMGIKSLKGIEYFTNLSSLYCSGNELTELDLRRNNNLVYLYCS